MGWRTCTDGYEPEYTAGNYDPDRALRGYYPDPPAPPYVPEYTSRPITYEPVPLWRRWWLKVRPAEQPRAAPPAAEPPRLHLVTDADLRVTRRDGRLALAEGVRIVEHAAVLLGDDPYPPDISDLTRRLDGAGRTLKRIKRRR